MKKFVYISIICLLIILNSIVVINYFVDPYWSFNHSFKFNQFQRASNERQQKTNQIYFGKENYDSLLFGSSRITLFDKRELKGKTFNFACSDMQPKEYKAFIDFAINEANQDIKTIYLGLDLYGSLSYGVKKFNESKQYGNLTLSKFYRYKLLLSIDALNNSAHNIKRFQKKALNTYNRNNIKTPFKLIGNNKNIFNTSEYIRYKYDPKERDPNFKNYLTELKEGYPNIKFVVFTTPVSTALMDEIIKNKLYPKYEAWLSDIVSVFGNVNNFMFKNKFSVQNKYFLDSNHAFPIYYKKIANVLNQEKIDTKIVIKINQNNILDKLKTLRILNHKVNI
jgi:hypothetical protein